MGKILLIVLVIAGAIGVFLLTSKQRPLSDLKSDTIMRITSSAFINNGLIPEVYTCDGNNINPPLSFSAIPPDTKSLALIMDDPDAPNGTFTHWVVYNIPAITSEIAEGSVPPGSVASNSANIRNYTGPCPPSGEHRYYFKLYALDVSIPQGSIANKSQLQEALSGHILDDAELLGRYTKR